MNARRIIGLALVIVGMVVFAWGGLFWTDRDTVLDAGPLKVQTQERKGIKLPPVLGGIAVVAGIILLVIPERRRV